MFDFIRKYMKVIAIPFFLIIILAFVFQSMGDYSGMTDKAATVATVGSSNITQIEWDAAHKNEVDRIRASRPNIDAKLLDSEQARYATLERLVREKVLAEAVSQKHVTTSDARLAKELQQDPTIASLRLPDGKQATREYVIHPGAVMVVAELPDGRLVLERQFRYPVQAVMVEFPAGKLDPGEDSLACAQRELLEETGYTARQWARAGVLHPVISYSTEFIDIWFARDLTAGQRQLDAGEFLDVFSASADELLQWCRDGRITDAKTLTGVLWLQNLRSGAWSLDWASV